MSAPPPRIRPSHGEIVGLQIRDQIIFPSLPAIWDLLMENFAVYRKGNCY